MHAINATTRSVSASHEAWTTDFRNARNARNAHIRSLGVVTHAKARGKREGGMGFVKEDNSGKANIFAVEPKTLYTSSPRADKEARKGLGGAQGLGLVVGLVGLVVAVALGVGLVGGGGVEDGRAGYDGGETLEEIAARL